MSRKITRRYRCPVCSNEQEFQQWDTINVTLNPELKAQLLSHQLTTFKCARCGNAIPIEHNLLYHDMAKHFMIWLMDANADRKSLSPIATILESLPPSSSKKYTLRRVHSFNDLIEKVLVLSDELDDRVTELLKVQLRESFQAENGHAGGTLFCLGKSDSASDRLVYRRHEPPKSQDIEIPIAKAREYFDGIMRVSTGGIVADGDPWQLIDATYSKSLLRRNEAKKTFGYKLGRSLQRTFGRTRQKTADSPRINSNDEDYFNPIEVRRRAALARGGVDLDDLVRRFTKRMNELPPMDFRSAAILVVPLGWFVMRPLYELRNHSDLGVQRLACDLIAKIEEMVEPPVQFEKPDRLLEAHAAKIFNIRGIGVLGSHQNAEVALDYFNRSLMLVSDNPVVLANKAAALGAMGKYAEAIDSIDLALSHDPSNQKLLLGRAEYLGLSGKLEESMLCFQALVDAGFNGAVKGVERCRRLLRKRADTN